MNFDRIFLSRNKKLRAGVVAVALFVSITACKGRASNPALNFAPVPDAQPQNSYADVVAKVAPAVITIRSNRRVRNPQQFPFFDDPFFRGCLAVKVSSSRANRLSRRSAQA